jgi:hypothetical protein
VATGYGTGTATTTLVVRRFAIETPVILQYIKNKFEYQLRKLLTQAVLQTIATVTYYDGEVSYIMATSSIAHVLYPSRQR